MDVDVESRITFKVTDSEYFSSVMSCKVSHWTECQGSNLSRHSIHPFSRVPLTDTHIGNTREINSQPDLKLLKLTIISIQGTTGGLYTPLPHSIGTTTTTTLTLAGLIDL